MIVFLFRYFQLQSKEAENDVLKKRLNDLVSKILTMFYSHFIFIFGF